MEELMELVKDMREAQKAYFKTRHLGDLNKSIELEKNVDLVIRRHYEPELF